VAARITILGAGFGALSAVRALRHRDPRAEITLVSPRAELHYLPGIIWIPSGLRTREQLIVPLDRSSSAWVCAMWRPRSPACRTAGARC
jgi:NADH dehydrogenase FAD-containing subunit